MTENVKASVEKATVTFWSMSHTDGGTKSEWEQIKSKNSKNETSKNSLLTITELVSNQADTHR